MHDMPKLSSRAFFSNEDGIVMHVSNTFRLCSHNRNQHSTGPFNLEMGTNYMYTIPGCEERSSVMAKNS